MFLYFSICSIILKMTRKLEEYCIVLGDRDIEKVRKLHGLVSDFKEKILTDKILQNFLYNRGYEMEEDRPEKYSEIGHVSIPGRMAAFASIYLDHMMDLATRPQLTRVESSKIIIPGEEQEVKFLSGNYDAEDIERLQRGWFENLEIVEAIRDYKENLEKSLDEFSMQTILSKTGFAVSNFIPNEKTWEEERKIQKKLLEAWDSGSVPVLDRAYYGMATRFFNSVSKIWERLITDDFGRKFVMTKEEIYKGLNGL